MQPQGNDLFANHPVIVGAANNFMQQLQNEFSGMGNQAGNGMMAQGQPQGLDMGTAFQQALQLAQPLVNPYVWQNTMQQMNKQPVMPNLSSNSANMNSDSQNQRYQALQDQVNRGGDMSTAITTGTTYPY